MHKAKACILLCIDFRFQKQTQSWLLEEGYTGHSDEIVVAGSSRDLVKPIENFHKDSILRQIDLSVKLHDPDEIVIIDHEDCGGYAQDETIKSGLSTDEDKNEHQHFAKIALDLLKEKYPAKEIKYYYATLKGAIEPMF